MRIALAFILAVAASPAAAQGWSFDSGDDGVWFGATAAAPGLMTVDLYCGGPSPQGKPLTGDHYEAVETKTGTFRLALGERAAGRSASMDLDASPADIRLSIDGAAQRLPPFEANFLHDIYEVTIPVKHPIVAALSSGGRLTVSVDGRNTYATSLTGSGNAITQAATFCARKRG